jgi:hypothetical protein
MIVVFGCLVFVSLVYSDQNQNTKSLILKFTYFFQLRDTDDNLSTGSRILSRMITRAQHSKVILAIIFLAILIAVGVGIYFSFEGW